MAEPNVFQQFLLDVFPGTPQAKSFQESKNQQGVLAARNAFVQEVARATSNNIPLPQAINDAIRSPAGIEFIRLDKDALSTPEKLIEVLKPAATPMTERGKMPTPQFQQMGKPGDTSTPEQRKFHGALVNPEDQNRLSVTDYYKAVAFGSKVGPEVMPAGVSPVTKQEAIAGLQIGQAVQDISMTDLYIHSVGGDSGNPRLVGVDPKTTMAALRTRAELGGRDTQDFFTAILAERGIIKKKDERESAQDIAAKERARLAAQSKPAPAPAPAQGGAAAPSAPALTPQPGTGAQLVIPPATPAEAAALPIEQVRILYKQVQAGKVVLTPEVAAVLTGRKIAGQ